MPRNWFHTLPSQSALSLDIIRWATALILIVHPIARIINGDVHGFGEFLSSEGFPFGVALAWLVTLLSMVCSVAMIIRRLVAPACMGHLIILLVGIVLDHAHDGWFVVGGGRNGMEYSITLIVCLFAVLWAYWPRRPVNN